MIKMKQTVNTWKLVNYFLFAGLVVNTCIMVCYKIDAQKHSNAIPKNNTTKKAKIELAGLNDCRQEETKILRESLQMAHDYFYCAELNLFSDRTSTIIFNDAEKTAIEKSVQEWYLGNISVQNDPMLVEAIADNIGSAVAIFQKTDVGFVCISSTLKNENYIEIGDVVSFGSCIGKAINEGETYTEVIQRGKEFVHAAYEPILHNSVLIGILSVSIATSEDKNIEGRLS